MRGIKRKGLLLWMMGTLVFFVILIITNILMQANGESGFHILGKNGLLALFLGCLIFYIVQFDKLIFKEIRKAFLYTALFLLALIPSVCLAYTQYIWLMPFVVASMIIAMVLDEGLGIITNLFFTLIISLIGGFQFDFIMFYILFGTFACLMMARTKERQKIFYISIYLMLINTLTLCLFDFTESVVNFNFDLWAIASGIINAALSIILTTGSLPVWETLFKITTPFKLLELTNSNHKLMRRLMLEAPGTYHHSQMVAHLAETAASDIGANALLARAGGLYHDIGKLKNPEYFIENQNGFNPHDELAPESSAKIIITHVQDGVKLANEHKLPTQIVDIIHQHQADAVIQYFYEKAKKHSDGFNVEAAPFSYPNPRPNSNEAAIVMLADCIEAYVRSLDETKRTMDLIQKMIYEIIHKKLQEGQLDACQIRLNEVPVIANAFRKVYNGMYHERVIPIKE